MSLAHHFNDKADVVNGWILKSGSFPNTEEASVRLALEMGSKPVTDDNLTKAWAAVQSKPAAYYYRHHGTVWCSGTGTGGSTTDKGRECPRWCSEGSDAERAGHICAGLGGVALFRGALMPLDAQAKHVDTLWILKNELFFRLRRDISQLSDTQAAQLETAKVAALIEIAEQLKLLTARNA
jgi:hypothetical protein